jgi:CTP:molybdopterin cytidylyltransferase MocA
VNVGVLLAAGASRRMGRNKALMRLGGQTFLARGVRQLWSACDAVIVVLGADAKRARAAMEEEFVRLVEVGALHRDLASARRHGAQALEVRFVVNRAWRRGMLGSSRLGLRAALRLGPETVLVLPVDHPGVKSATVRALAEAMRAALGAYRGSRSKPSAFAYALVPRYRRRRGHPLALSPVLAKAIVADSGATDLSDAVRRSARLVGYLDCGDAGVVRNRNRLGD